VTAAEAADARPRRSDPGSPRRALVALCVGQVTSWGVLYYAFPVALAAISADTGWSPAVASAAFSAGLVVSALAGIPVGRWLDRYGPRRVMTAGSALAVPATMGIALAPTYGWFLAAWLLAGLAMAAVLYQAAFAAVTRWFGDRRVHALTVLTLVAGLSSTVFAPLTDVLLTHLSWRTTYLALAVLLALVTVPLHALALTPPWQPAEPSPAAEPPGRGLRRVPPEARTAGFLLLSAALTLTAFGLYGASLALIPLLTGRGLSAGLAALTLGLLGAGQLLGRFGYAPLAARTGPAGRALLIIGASAVTIGLLAVLTGPPALLVAVAIAAGAARGAGTLLQATVVADRWGTARYATLSALFSAPITIAIAVAPGAGVALAAALGSYPRAFAVLAGVVVLAIGVAAWGGRSHQPGAAG
jgi:predicted MFS family arabinose efflux permease